MAQLGRLSNHRRHLDLANGPDLLIMDPAPPFTSRASMRREADPILVFLGGFHVP